MSNPLNRMEGGNHYTRFRFQPIQFIIDQNYDFIFGNIFKYLSRAKYKNGAEDVSKAIHYVELTKVLWKEGFWYPPILNSSAITIEDFIKINNISGEDAQVIAFIHLWMRDLSYSVQRNDRTAAMFPTFEGVVCVLSNYRNELAKAEAEGKTDE